MIYHPSLAAIHSKSSKRNKNSRRGFIPASLRLACFFGWSIVIIFLWLIRRIFIEKSTSAVVAARYSRLWSRGVLLLLELKIKVVGKPPLAPFFLVTNHLGYLDIAVLASQLDCTFVAKSQVASWPLFGALASLSGTLFINRESMRDTERVNGHIAKHFLSGGSLVLFPEGTSSNGEGVLPFGPSLLHYPCDNSMPVHSAAIKYTIKNGADQKSAGTNGPNSAAQIMCWWGKMTLWPHLVALFRTRGLEAEINFSGITHYHTDRKDLATQLQAEVYRSLPTH